MVVGIILGASIFVQPSEIARLVPSSRGVILVWLAAGALTLCGALVCAELASAFPSTGGVYVFLRQIFSPALGFLWGWAMFWVVHSGIIAAIAVMLARYVGYFFPLADNGIRLVAMVAIGGLSAVNCLGVKPGSTVQLVLTSAKVLAVALMVLLLFGLGGDAHRSFVNPSLNQAISLGSYGLAVGAGLFAYGGWHMVTYAAGETRDPTHTIPRALMIGMAVVTAIYMLVNSAYDYVLPLSDVARSSRVAADATEHILGARTGRVIAGLVVLSALGALNGIILAGPRVYYAMANDRLAFAWMGRVHTRWNVPHLAIFAQAIWSCVLVATNSYRELFSRVVYTEWMFFALLAVGIFILRRRKDYKPVFKLPGYPVIPAIFVVVAAAIVVNQLRSDPRGSAVGLSLILLGLPVYFVWSRRLPKKAIADAGH